MNKHTQLVRESQKRHIEKHRARNAIRKKVDRGLFPKASSLICFDCSKVADCYDHYNGYEGENRFKVQAVCWPCHRERGKERKEYKNGTTINYAT